MADVTKEMVLPVAAAPLDTHCRAPSPFAVCASWYCRPCPLLTTAPTLRVSSSIRGRGASGEVVEMSPVGEPSVLWWLPSWLPTMIALLLVVVAVPSFSSLELGPPRPSCSFAGGGGCRWVGGVSHVAYACRFRCVFERWAGVSTYYMIKCSLFWRQAHGKWFLGRQVGVFMVW